MTGTHLRLIAIKADQEDKNTDDNAFGNGFADDVIGNFSKSEKLEQAAWIINRIFTTCLNDRSTEITETRKWGVYSSANLLFKTYFKVCSASSRKTHADRLCYSSIL